MDWGCIMEHIRNLIKILNILDAQWGKLTPDLTREQLSNLKLEFSGLENQMKSVGNVEEINNLSKDFIQIFSKVEPLEFLTNIDKTPMRSGSLNEEIEEIRIKIINYCVALQERIISMDNVK